MREDDPEAYRAWCDQYPTGASGNREDDAAVATFPAPDAAWFVNVIGIDVDGGLTSGMS